MTDAEKSNDLNSAKAWRNLPNQLTICRIVLIFIFIILAYFDANQANSIKVSPETAHICHVIALIIAIIAGLTDFFDGYLARKLKVESDFGRLMDPLADKIFVLATCMVMVEYGLIPGWILIMILAREFMVTGLRTLASAKGVVIAADRWGKLKTFLQMMTLLISGLYWVGITWIDIQAGFGKVIWFILLGLVTLLTVGSGLGYFIKYRKLYLDSAC